jgi:amidase
MHRRHLLQSTCGAAAALLGAMAPKGPALATTPPAAPAHLIEEVPATQLAAALRSRQLSASVLLQACLARIDAVDRSGPRLNSVIELNPEAADIARALDADAAAGRWRGPLHGLPVLLKDNIATGDKMATTAGSLALEGVRATRDAHLVQRLRAAGAVILGKTNLSEWANIRSTRSTSGWSARGGLTRNPYALDRSTSGSSSGSAAAVAASLAPLAVGTETDGSITSPASICGLVGLKPTVGRISRDGIIPISHTQDTAGPMTRSVADAALLYAALAGNDAADGITGSAPAFVAINLSGIDGPQPLAGLRLGVARQFFTRFDEADAVVERALQQLKDLGAQIIDPVDLAQPDYGDAELAVLLYELKHGLAQWLKSFAPQAPVQTLADVIAFNQNQRTREMPWFGQELFVQAQALGGLDSPAYREALATCAKGAREQGLDRVFQAQKLDALVAPTGGLGWLIDPINGDAYGTSFTSPAAVAGYPHLTVPAGLVRGLPLGLSFVGPAWSEAALLRMGAAYEHAAQARRAPGYLPRSVPV